MNSLPKIEIERLHNFKIRRALSDYTCYKCSSPAEALLHAGDKICRGACSKHFESIRTEMQDEIEADWLLTI